MIAAHRDWATLLPALRKDAASIAALPEGLARAVLAGPCAVAGWIVHRAPHLAARGSLSLLIVGAESADAPDQGRWYQILPTLLAAPSLQIEVVLVGLELDVTFASAAAAQAPAVPAQTARMSLGSFMEQRADQSFDLAFAFHPGLQKHRAWLADDGFPRLLERTPLVCVAFGRDEYEMERWIAEAYGFGVGAEPLANPLDLDVSDARTSIRWGHVLWSLQTAPAAGREPDARRLDALETLSRMVLHSIARSGAAAPPLGAEVALVATTGTRRVLLHVADNRFLDRDTRELLLLGDGSLELLGHVGRDVTNSYPGAAASELERAVWAAQVKATCLLNTYDGSQIGPAREVAAGMLSDLRERLAKLFQG